MLRPLPLIVLLGLAMPGVVFGQVQATFYVAPDGNDHSLGTKAQPFATIARAQQAVRAINQDMTGDIVVELRGGVYTIDRTIAFDAADSGTNGHNVIYRAAPNETPVISGGKPVVGWRADKRGRWKAPSPVDDCRQLYVNGKRATRARGPAPANLKLAGENGYTTTDVSMADWRSPGDIEFCYLTVWAHCRCKVQSVKRDGDKAVITMLQPYFTHAKTKEGVRVSNPAHLQRIYLENAIELLDEPGEWYLDRSTKTIYYMPREGEDMTKAAVIAPAVEKLVEFRGSLPQPVHNIRFENVTFKHANWLRPSKIGHCEVQANCIIDSDRKDSFVRAGGFVNVHNENLKSQANIVLHAAKAIRFERCTFTQLGGAAIDIERGSQDNVISGCAIYDIAGSGVQIGDVLKDDHHPDDPRKIVKNNRVVNCCIHDCCLDYRGGIGIWVGYTEGTTLAHNEIAHLPYSGISMGWGWGEEDAGGGNPDAKQPFKYDTPTSNKNNHIEYNHIHHVMQTMHDGGAIYTLGVMPGSIIRGNHIHDALRSDVGPGGIYLDEGSGFIEVTGNLVYKVKTPMFYNNLVQNRKATCNEHDNFFNAKPDDAKNVVEKAGLEPAYRGLLKP
ncbi:MAG: right-handed parallel beta-helix repeat-containing protein [Thermoguttaceae bacterium]